MMQVVGMTQLVEMAREDQAGQAPGLWGSDLADLDQLVFHLAGHVFHHDQVE